MKLIRYLANLGYGSRREMECLLSDERVCTRAGKVLTANDAYVHEDVLIDGDPLDPEPGLVLMLNKPVGYVCSTKDAGKLVYDLLPRRYRHRDPIVSPIGRLDRDTSGLLLFTDDGQLLHRITSPKRHLPKVYQVELASELRGDEAAIFASGTLLLESEDKPLAPAQLHLMSARLARVTLTEGRYHQVRRMFAAVGNHVCTLHRLHVGALTLDGLAAGQWRALNDDEIAGLSR
ncbi:MAG: pseudouridine synthase [Pseudomonadota bacterium]|nr:pseudouridine synthase [Pseudomonadota bacterium]